jgi:hypothetical protein
MAETMQFLNIESYEPNEFEGDMQTDKKAKSTEKASQKIKNSESNNDQMTQINQVDTDKLSTLDEPVVVTIKRDLKAVAYKFGHVFFPKQSTSLLKDWDLWGPLFLSVLLAISLQGTKTEFADVFVYIALGSVIVTVNTKLLSGKISFFQSICVLGYCLLPLVLVSVLSNLLLSKFFANSITLFSIRCTIVFVSFAWSVFASTAFLESNVTNLKERKMLALYPIFLFYFVIAWFIILHKN